MSNFSPVFLPLLARPVRAFGTRVLGTWAVACALAAPQVFAQVDTAAYRAVEQALHRQQWARAQELSQQHLQRHPSDPQMRLLVSRLLEAQGQHGQAQQALQALAQEFPELPEPHNNLAVHYARQGRTQDAIDSLTRALQARPTDATALDNLGRLHLSLAQQAYQRASAAPDAPESAARMAKAISQWIAPSKQ